MPQYISSEGPIKNHSSRSIANVNDYNGLNKQVSGAYKSVSQLAHETFPKIGNNQASNNPAVISQNNETSSVKFPPVKSAAPQDVNREAANALVGSLTKAKVLLKSKLGFENSQEVEARMKEYNDWTDEIDQKANSQKDKENVQFWLNVKKIPFAPIKTWSFENALESLDNEIAKVKELETEVNYEAILEMQKKVIDLDMKKTQLDTIKMLGFVFNMQRRLNQAKAKLAKLIELNMEGKSLKKFKTQIPKLPEIPRASSIKPHPPGKKAL